jgi:predicted nucleotidyltransferase
MTIPLNESAIIKLGSCALWFGGNEFLYLSIMDNTKVHDLIRQTVQANMPGARVMLFGSRARGDHDVKSDYDLLVITPTTLEPRQKVQWSTLLDKAIVKDVRVPVDLLLNSEEEILEKQQLPGHIIRSVMREGVML